MFAVVRFQLFGQTIMAQTIVYEFDKSVKHAHLHRIVSALVIVAIQAQLTDV